MGYRIGSFNVLNMNYRSDKESSKNFAKFAKIIGENNFDIIAFQEVLNEGSVKKIVDNLDISGKNWGMIFSLSEKQQHRKRDEGYAYIWNKRTMTLVPNNQDESYRYRNPRIIIRNNLIRSPYYARFQPNNLPQVEFRLINTHIIFSADKNEEDSGEHNIENYDNEENDQKKMTNIFARKAEFDTLTKDIYYRISTTAGKTSYTILLGDYNLEKHQLNDVEITGGRRITTVQEEKTTLKRPPDKEKEPDKYNEFIPDFSNNYDHFSYDLGRFQGIIARPSVINTVMTQGYGMTTEGFVNHRREISDHIPICLDIELNTRNAIPLINK